jgi:hypothetical protein
MNERGSVADPWHVGTDPDLRILTCDERIRILVRDLQIGN